MLIILLFLSWCFVLPNSALAVPSTVDIFQDIERGLFYQNSVSVPSSLQKNLNIDHSQDSFTKTHQTAKITLEKAPGNYNSREDYTKMEQMAYLAASNGYYEVAVELYKRLLKIQPTNYYFKFGLASAYQNMNQINQAKPIYLQILKQFPNDTKVINNLLNILIEESPVEAAYFLEDLAIKNPHSPYINAQAGLAYQNIGNYASAYTFLNKAVQLDPHNIQYQFNLAVVLDKNKEYQAAINNYRLVLNNSDKNIMDEQTLKAVQHRVAYLENL